MAEVLVELSETVLDIRSINYSSSSKAVLVFLKHQCLVFNVNLPITSTTSFILFLSFCCEQESGTNMLHKFDFPQSHESQLIDGTFDFSRR